MKRIFIILTVVTLSVNRMCGQEKLNIKKNQLSREMILLSGIGLSYERLIHSRSLVHGSVRARPLTSFKQKPFSSFSGVKSSYG